MTGAHRLERARRLLALPDGWLEAAGGGYALRNGRDRRARVMLMLDETDFAALSLTPGLRTRPGGGWTACPAPGRPGVVEGVRAVMLPDGGMTERQANLNHSPVVWLAGRIGADGRPWLSKAEVAAAGQLALDAEIASQGSSVTMRWDGLPRTGRGGGRPALPYDRALSAAGRVNRALTACGPARDVVDHVCLRGMTLHATEQALGLRRRTGKAILRLGLTALARHYRAG